MRRSAVRSSAYRHPDAWDGRACATRPTPCPSSALPVVMMTVKNTPTHVLESLRREASAYLSKPFSRDMLLATLHNASANAVPADDIKILSDKPNWISLQIRCRLATADRLTQFVRELPSDLEPDQREQIATAFRELLMNAVEHGGHLDPEKTVDLSYIRTARMHRLLYSRSRRRLLDERAGARSDRQQPRRALRITWNCGVKWAFGPAVSDC